LARRQTNGKPDVIALSWKAQRRLHHVWQRMQRRNKRRTIIAVAQARSSQPSLAVRQTLTVPGAG
jgi:hypothetical protein